MSAKANGDAKMQQKLSGGLARQHQDTQRGEATSPGPTGNPRRGWNKQDASQKGCVHAGDSLPQFSNAEPTKKGFERGSPNRRCSLHHNTFTPTDQGSTPSFLSKDHIGAADTGMFVKYKGITNNTFLFRVMLFTRPQIQLKYNESVDFLKFFFTNKNFHPEMQSGWRDFSKELKKKIKA